MLWPLLMGTIAVVIALHIRGRLAWTIQIMDWNSTRPTHVEFSGFGYRATFTVHRTEPSTQTRKQHARVKLNTSAGRTTGPAARNQQRQAAVNSTRPTVVLCPPSNVHRPTPTLQRPVRVFRGRKQTTPLNPSSRSSVNQLAPPPPSPPKRRYTININH